MTCFALLNAVIVCTLFNPCISTANSSEFKSPDIVVEVDGDLRVWSLSDSFSPGTFFSDGLFVRVESPETSYMMVSQEGIFDFDTASQITFPKPVTNYITGFKLNDSGRLALISYYDRPLTSESDKIVEFSSVVDIQENIVLFTRKNSDVALSPSGNLFAVAGEFGIEIFNVKTQSMVSRLETPGYIDGGLFKPSKGYNYRNPIFGPRDDIGLVTVLHRFFDYVLCTKGERTWSHDLRMNLKRKLFGLHLPVV